MEFNLQQFLAEMREEQRDEHKTMMVAVKEVTEWTRKHELADQIAFGELSNRLKPLEGVHRAAKWFVGVSIIAMLSAAADVYFNHSAQQQQPVYVAIEPAKAHR